LLDQSGSIRHNASIVFDAAVLITEAFRGAHGYRTFIYSHSTDFKAPIVYTYECGQDIREALPEYINEQGRFWDNLDDLAIRAVASIRERITGRSKKRLLIVISDGKPCGVNGIENTRNAVEQLRKNRWKIINVAVGTSGKFDEIYGEKYTAKSSFNGLAHNLGRIVYRELQGF
jgi:hypothetical protein